MHKIKSVFLLFLLLLFTSIYSEAGIQIKRPASYDLTKESGFKRFEFGLFFDIGLPQFEFDNSFSDSETYYWYDSSYWYYTEYDISLNYSSNVSGAAEIQFGFGGFINYLFHKNIGIQFMLETSRFDVPVEASHSVNVSWDYSWGDYSSDSESPSIKPNTGSLSVMPISFNIITKFHLGSIISGHASGGLTYYQVDFEAESEGGAAVWYYKYASGYDLWFLYGDSVLFPIYIDDSYNGIGANVGGGLSFEVHKNIGILLDFRYYIGPKEEFVWETSSGSYDTVIYGDTLNISQDLIDDTMGEIEKFITVEVDPSYYRFSLALQFMF